MAAQAKTEELRAKALAAPVASPAVATAAPVRGMRALPAPVMPLRSRWENEERPGPALIERPVARRFEMPPVQSPRLMPSLDEPTPPQFDRFFIEKPATILAEIPSANPVSLIQIQFSTAVPKIDWLPEVIRQSLIPEAGFAATSRPPVIGPALPPVSPLVGIAVPFERTPAVVFRLNTRPLVLRSRPSVPMDLLGFAPPLETNVAGMPEFAIWPSSGRIPDPSIDPTPAPKLTVHEGKRSAAVKAKLTVLAAAMPVEPAPVSRPEPVTRPPEPQPRKAVASAPPPKRRTVLVPSILEPPAENGTSRSLWGTLRKYIRG